MLKGKDILELQKKLIGAGHDIRPDGFYGGETAHHHRVYMYENGIREDKISKRYDRLLGY